MNTGMQDACNLAWKLALVVRGIGSESLLDSYSAERSPIAEQVLKVTGRVTSMATLTGKVKQSLRNHGAALVLGVPMFRKFAADAAAEISIGYPRWPLNGPGGRRDPSPGARAPIRATEPPVGAGNTPRFALFAEPDGIPSKFPARYASLVEPRLGEPYHPGSMWLICGRICRPFGEGRRVESGHRLPRPHRTKLIACVTLTTTVSKMKAIGAVANDLRAVSLGPWRTRLGEEVNE
jgi:hypothetical protein